MSIPGTWTTGRVGIVMMSALGDTVHALPVVNALKRHAPRCRITWILQPGPAELVRGHPAVDELIVFERAKGWRAYLDLRRRLRPFDLVLALQVYFKAGIVTALTRAPVKLGFDRARARDLNWLVTTHRIPPHAPQHVQDQYLEFLAYLGVPAEPIEWGLAPSAAEREAARSLVGPAGRPLVGLVVATSKPQKNWPAERYAELATRLAATQGARCVLLGGNSPLERAAADTILARIGAGVAATPIDALGRGLRTTLGVLAECDVVVSPDTGPFHMCVAMNVPAVGLYGYTNPKRVGPYRRFRDLMIDAYGDPGEDYRASAGYRAGRMERISVEMVLAKVAQALRR